VEKPVDVMSDSHSHGAGKHVLFNTIDAF
jgi:hypothetical protein